MKHRLTAALLTLAALFSLAACSGTQTSDSEQFPLTLAQQLRVCGAFSEELEELEADILWQLYNLEDAGLKPEQMTDAVGYGSTGATCEEVSVLHFTDALAAGKAENALLLYLEDQILANENYRPAEIPKLKTALVSRRGSTVLLMVANDPDKAQDLLK